MYVYIHFWLVELFFLIAQHHCKRGLALNDFRVSINGKWINDILEVIPPTDAFISAKNLKDWSLFEIAWKEKKFSALLQRSVLATRLYRWLSGSPEVLLRPDTNVSWRNKDGHMLLLSVSKVLRLPSPAVARLFFFLSPSQRFMTTWGKNVHFMLF